MPTTCSARSRPQPPDLGLAVSHDGEARGRLEPPGARHPQRPERAAALVAGIGLGLPAAEVLEGLSLFSGTRRRFDFKGEVAGIRVFDDYAHHPTEIAATLRAAREVVGEGNLVVAFQAHHYYRTAMFVDEFGAGPRAGRPGRRARGVRTG